MPRCTRKGCNKEFTEDSNEACIFHPGAPVFHEGLKSWSCCSDVNKPVLEFDEFMKIAVFEPSKAPTNPNNLAVSFSEDGKEVYTSETVPTNTSSQSESKPPASQPIVSTQTPPPAIEEEDDLSVPVALGTKCLRKGCGKLFVSDELNRLGDGEGTVCVYHPSPPIFREGSKGYLCCKRRVLEFDEFLKIEGCKTGRHLFAVKVAPGPTLTECRIEHYQTVDKVHVSIYAKKADKDKTTVKFESDKVYLVILDILFQDTKRFTRTIDLVGPINADMSTFQIMGTKVELHLQKEDGRSWPVLEKSELVKIGNYAVTFGVGGRTGTIGGKEII
ncbi:chord-domain-containing protein, partial [Desarmillaria tabescens]